MKDLFNQYTSYVSNPHTKLQYTYSFRIFNDYLNLIDKDIETITTEDVLNFTQWLKSKFNPSTIKVRIGNIKTFFKWLEEFKGYKRVNWRLIPCHYKMQRRLTFLDHQELNSIRRCIKTNTFEGLRLRASFEFLLSTGCRLEEFISLRLSDINILNRTVCVKGKGGKYGTVYLNDKSITWLSKYLAQRTDDSDWLWVSQRQGVKQLNYKVFQSQLLKLKECSPVKKDWSAHTLRHSHATIMLKNGADIFTIKELLRHQNINTTQIYLHITNLDLAKKHRKYLKV